MSRLSELSNYSRDLVPRKNVTTTFQGRVGEWMNGPRAVRGGAALWLSELCWFGEQCCNLLRLRAPLNY